MAVDARPGPLGEVSLVAATSFRESRRRPGAWLSSALIGAMFAGLLLMIGLVSGRVQDVADRQVLVVAVGGDLDGGAGVLEMLEDDRLSLVPAEDPAGDVIDRLAAAAVIVPEGADAKVAAGEPVEIAISYRATEAGSEEAQLVLLRRLQAAEVEVLTGATASSSPVVLDVEPVLRDEQVGRVGLARQVGAIAALLCLGVVTAVAGTLGGAREQRTLEPMLVLPLRRWALSGGVTTGSFPLAATQVVAGVGLLVATAAVPSSTAHQSASTVLAMLLGGALASLALAAVACATGVVAGSLGTGTDDAVSLGDLLALPFVGIGIGMFIAQAWEPPTAAYAVPGLGQALVVRDAVAGSIEAVPAAVAVGSAIVTVGVLVAVAGRLLGGERRILRAS